MNDHITVEHKEITDGTAVTSSSRTRSKAAKVAKQIKVELLKNAAEPQPDSTSQQPQAKARPDYKPLIKSMKRCRVCLKSGKQIALEKADEVHDFYVKCLAKISASTAASLKFLDDGGGRMKIALYFCQPCKMKLQLSDRLIDDLKTADENFDLVLQTLLSLGTAEMRR